jgi:hypothetical protein
LAMRKALRATSRPVAYRYTACQAPIMAMCATTAMILPARCEFSLPLSGLARQRRCCLLAPGCVADQLLYFCLTV